MENMIYMINQQFYTKKLFDYDTREFPLEFFINTIPKDFKSTWLDSHRSKYIESLLCGVPQTNILLLKEVGSKFILLNNLEQIYAIHLWLENKFSLRYLEYLTEFENKNFNEIPSSVKRKFILKELRCIVLSEKTHIDEINYLINL